MNDIAQGQSRFVPRSRPSCFSLCEGTIASTLRTARMSPPGNVQQGLRGKSLIRIE